MQKILFLIEVFTLNSCGQNTKGRKTNTRKKNANIITEKRR